jgi:hypothetical protein
MSGHLLEDATAVRTTAATATTEEAATTKAAAAARAAAGIGFREPLLPLRD